MKTLVTLYLLTFTLMSSAQVNKGQEYNVKTAAMILSVGGCGVSLAGFLTAPDVYWSPSSTGSTLNTTLSQRGNWQQQSFFQQGPKTYAIIGGLTVTVTGLIMLITSKKQ